MTFEPGQRVTWVHEMRGGYGYTERIPAEVVRVTAKRVTIRVRLQSGAHVTRSVKRENLRPAER